MRYWEDCRRFTERMINLAGASDIADEIVAARLLVDNFGMPLTTARNSVQTLRRFIRTERLVEGNLDFRVVEREILRMVVAWMQPELVTIKRMREQGVRVRIAA